MTPQVNTRTTADFRALRFDSIEECVAEIRRILAADSVGALRSIGNWTPGQVMGHVAAWIEYGYVGYPIAPPPFFVRWILRLRLQKMLQNGMPRGVRIPRVAGGTVGTDEMPTSLAGERLLKALQRLQNQDDAKFDSPAFGPMSHQDRIRLNLRHAELHLGFLNY